MQYLGSNRSKIVRSMAQGAKMLRSVVGPETNKRLAEWADKAFPAFYDDVTSSRALATCIKDSGSRELFFTLSRVFEFHALCDLQESGNKTGNAGPSYTIYRDLKAWDGIAPAGTGTGFAWQAINSEIDAHICIAIARNLPPGAVDTDSTEGDKFEKILHRLFPEHAARDSVLFAHINGGVRPAPHNPLVGAIKDLASEVFEALNDGGPLSARKAFFEGDPGACYSLPEILIELAGLTSFRDRLPEGPRGFYSLVPPEDLMRQKQHAIDDAAVALQHFIKHYNAVHPDALIYEGAGLADDRSTIFSVQFRAIPDAAQAVANELPGYFVQNARTGDLLLPRRIAKQAASLQHPGLA